MGRPPDAGLGVGAVLALLALLVFAGVLAGVGAAAGLALFLEWIGAPE